MKYKILASLVFAGLTACGGGGGSSSSGSNGDSGSSGQSGGDGAVTNMSGNCVVADSVLAVPEGGTCTITADVVSEFSLSVISAGTEASCTDGRITAGGLSAGTQIQNGSLTIRCATEA